MSDPYLTNATNSGAPYFEMWAIAQRPGSPHLDCESIVYAARIGAGGTTISTNPVATS
jgi:hypothetical protein